MIVRRNDGPFSRSPVSKTMTLKSVFVHSLRCSNIKEAFHAVLLMYVTLPAFRPLSEYIALSEQNTNIQCLRMLVECTLLWLPNHCPFNNKICPRALELSKLRVNSQVSLLLLLCLYPLETGPSNSTKRPHAKRLSEAVQDEHFNILADYQSSMNMIPASIHLDHLFYRINLRGFNI